MAKKRRKGNMQRRDKGNGRIKGKMLADMAMGNLISEDDFDREAFNDLGDKLFAAHDAGDSELIKKYSLEIEKMGGMVQEKPDGNLSIFTPSIGG